MNKCNELQSFVTIFKIKKWKNMLISLLFAQTCRISVFKNRKKHTTKEAEHVQHAGMDEWWYGGLIEVKKELTETEKEIKEGNREAKWICRQQSRCPLYRIWPLSSPLNQSLSFSRPELRYQHQCATTESINHRSGGEDVVSSLLVLHNHPSPCLSTLNVCPAY